MRESETFDAFYVRTVAHVTSQMHELAGGDALADHAVREAYARAYQQWYEVSGYRDPENWVLDIAKEAFERRRVQGAPAAVPPPDTGTWPGMYREPAVPRQAPDPDSTLARPNEGRRGAAAAGDVAAAGAGFAAADGAAQVGEAAQAGGFAQGGPIPSSLFGSTGPGLAIPSDPFGVRQRQAGAPGQAGGTALMADRTGTPGTATTGIGKLGQFGGNTKAVAAAAAAVVVLGVLGYFAFSTHHSNGTPSGQHTISTKTVSKPKAQMLPAGKVGGRGAIPWSLLGSGWTLAEFSATPPAAGGSSSASAGYTMDLVDPKGGRYQIATWSGTGTPALIGWSGDGSLALFSVAGASDSVSYELLALRNGGFTQISLPAGVTVAGFTRPDGLALLAVKRGPVRYKLQRYSLGGVLQKTIATMPDNPAPPNWPTTCSGFCAMSSPDGDLAVWGVYGQEMQVLSNAGGPVRKLHVPGSGKPPSCEPISWWDAQTVLASCVAASPGSGATGLWLVPADGATPTLLAVASGSASTGVGYNIDAWQAAGQDYVVQTTAAGCSSGALGAEIARATSSGSVTPDAIPESTGDHNTIIGSMGGRLLILAQTSCPGTSSLLLFDPAKGSAQPLLTAPASEQGVIAAAAYGEHPPTFAGN
jgi:hypothetical protein